MGKIQNNKGITIIALIVTIILLLILAGIVIQVLNKDNGLLKVTQKAKEEYNKQSAKEILEVILYEYETETIYEPKDLVEFLKQKGLMAEDLGDYIQTEVNGYIFWIDKKTSEILEKGNIQGTVPVGTSTISTTEQNQDYVIVTIKVTNLEQLENQIETIYIDNAVELEDQRDLENGIAKFKITKNGKYEAIVKVKDGRTGIIQIDEITNVVSDSIIDYVRNNDLTDGIHKLTIKGVTYSLEVYNFYDDVMYEESPILGNKNTDSGMLVLKYHKNLIIKEGAILTPQVRKKGMLVCVMGQLENNGEISMTARGAKAVGENVYLWKNKDGSYEYVPANGASGAARVASKPDVQYNGKNRS